MPRYKHTLTFVSDDPMPVIRAHCGYADITRATILEVPLSSIQPVSSEPLMTEPVVLSWPRVTISESDGLIRLIAHQNPEYFKTGYWLTTDAARKFGQALIDFADQVNPDENEEN